MGTSETPGQLTERLEMGQGGTVHFFIACERRRWGRSEMRRRRRCTTWRMR